jgi:hypothetical protein
MKTNYFKKLSMVMAVASLALLAVTLLAQSAADNAAPQAAAVSPAPYLSGGASEILRLTQAKVGDDTVIAYIKNSGNGYALNADQIIYLRQQGVSDAVINVMLIQPKTSVAASTSASTVTTSSSGSTIATPSGSTATVAPTVTYVQSVPATTCYYQPYYYPSYAWYPPVVFSFGWGWHGGGFHGGGWHR